MAQSVEDRRRYNREWARAHYVPKRRPTVQERLWARVTKSDGCWEWTGPLALGGRYGGIRCDGRTRPVHRLTYEWENGPVPVGLEIDHLCRNHRCVRPDHLEAVTHAENMRRGEGFAGRNARKTHCKRHEVALSSLPGGGRGCRLCIRENNVRYRRRLGGGTHAEGSLRTWAARTPERRAEISRKIWETRRRNAA